jgi:serine-type D-Ala-D-Ala carboxypeptidase/endopeptidase
LSLAVLRRSLLTVLAVFGGLRSAWAQGVTRPPITVDSLESLVRARVSTGLVPGLAAGVLHAGGARLVTSAGTARPGVDMDEHVVVEIGSITKAFTGILLAEMAGRGEVHLEQPVSELLPPGTRLPSRSGKQITLLQLATHTSGLPRLPDNMRPADMANPYADYSVGQLYEFLARHELRRDPGAQYEYSNLGAGLLGHALALRAGMSYEELVRERVLGPLGMTSTSITLDASQKARGAQGVTPDGDVSPYWDLPTFAGAGALRSTLGDMLRFLYANLRPPEGALGRAIAASHMARFRVNAALSLGLGWHMSTFRGETILWHNGGTGGFHSMMAWNPGTGTGAVVLGNSQHDFDDIALHVVMGTIPD